VSLAVLKQQRRLCAPAVSEAGSTGLQQHVARPKLTKAALQQVSAYQTDQHSAQASFPGMTPAMQQKSPSKAARKQLG